METPEITFDREISSIFQELGKNSDFIMAAAKPEKTKSSRNIHVIYALIIISIVIIYSKEQCHIFSFQ